ncbi:hypothetical protein F4X73_11430 [Candidatus Poribacteria bacterium]|nr:hypothetical protein [Candidatus Poribacteria bacterium]
MSILCNALFVFCTVSALMFNLYNANTTFAQNRENTALQGIDASIVGSSLELDGETGYVEIRDSDVLNTLNTQLTVSAWIKTSTYPDRYSSILYKGDPRTPDIINRSFLLFLREDGAVQLASSPKGMSEYYVFSHPGSITPNQWHHITGVIDSENDIMKIYIDGTLANVSFFQGANGMYESVLPLRIGNSHEEERPTLSLFIGQIDEVRVWNIALNDKQIQDSINKQLTGTEKGLVAYWNFDKVTDEIVPDLSPNKNHGRLIGNAKTADYIRQVSTLNDAQLDIAANIFKERIKEGTNNLSAYLSLAEIHMRKNRHTDAEKIYLSALDLKLSGYEQDVVITELQKLFNLRNANDAFIKLLEELKPKMEGSAILHELLGDAYMEAGEEEKAQIAYKQWLRIQKSNVDSADPFDENSHLTEKLLNKNLFPEDALDFVIDSTESSATSSYVMTLGYALLVNELYSEAYQLIETSLNAAPFPFMERRWFRRITRAGRYVKDKAGYVEVLERLIDVMPTDSPNYFNSVFALAQFYMENDLEDQANERIKKTGFVSEDAWMVLAPFENRQGNGFDTKFIDENLLKIDTKTEYDGKHGKISWRKYEDEVLNGYIGLGDDEDWATGYAYAVVISPEDRHVDFRFDSDDQGKVWLNGKSIFKHTKAFTAQIDFFDFPANLKKGRNIILVKVCEETGGWGFYLRITDKNGNPYDDLEIVPAGK